MQVWLSSGLGTEETRSTRAKEAKHRTNKVPAASVKRGESPSTNLTKPEVFTPNSGQTVGGCGNCAQNTHKRTHTRVRTDPAYCYPSESNSVCAWQGGCIEKLPTRPPSSEAALPAAALGHASRAERAAATR